MAFRSLSGLRIVFVFLAIAASLTSDVCGEDRVRQTPSVAQARARFLNRIHEMLSEAAKMEAAGRPQDAILVAVRATRMLDALGGESAWPRGETTPAQFVASLAERNRPSAQKLRATQPDSPGGEVPRTMAAAGPAKHSPSSPAPARAQAVRQAAKPPTTLNRFPDLPATGRTWVPVGEPVQEAGDWTPVGKATGSAGGHTISRTGVEFPFSPATQADQPAGPQIPVFGPGGVEIGNDTETAADTISDSRVGPIPIHLTPEIRSAAGIDIRANEPESQPNSTGRNPDPGEPLEFRPIAEPVPMNVPPAMPSQEALPSSSGTTSDRKPTGSNALTRVNQAAETPASNETPPSKPKKTTSDNSRLLFATLTGAVGGIFLVLAGGFLVRRLRQHSAEPIVIRLEEPVSAPAESTEVSLMSPEVAQTVATDKAWQPGSSWVEPESESAPIVPNPVPSETATRETPASSPQLQIYREAPTAEPKPVSEKPESEAATGSEMTAAGMSTSTPPVTPAVPFRVLGTSVVLGEAASEKVDEELQQRRQTIMKAVFEGNVAIQNPQNESSSKVA
jgi:hypothetical protein